MRRSAVVLAFAVILPAVILLSGCAAHAEASPTHSTKVAPSPTATPTVSAVALPTDCTKVVAADVYAKELAPTPLNDPAFIAADAANAVTPSKPKPGAGFSQKLAAAVDLRCVWRDPATPTRGMTLTLAHVDVDTATSFLSRAKLLHWNCADTHGGRECQKAEQSGKQPVATLRTVFLRDDVFIDVTQSNFITNDIVGSVVATLWPR